MDRISLIQFLINKKKYITYLEIGTQKGLSFFPIKCKKKIAVDPVFLIQSKEKLKWLINNPYNLRNSYFEMTSDEFFLKKEKYLTFYQPDIIFIDGLHTFEATLKDILNSLLFLRNNGTIVIHDCYPPHKAAAEPGLSAEEVALRSESIEGWTGEWCGDTWKAMAYLRTKYRNDLKVVVLNDDYGLGVVQKISSNPLDLNIDYRLFNQIKSLKYEDLTKTPRDLIGLRESKSYLEL